MTSSETEPALPPSKAEVWEARIFDWVRCVVPVHAGAEGQGHIPEESDWGLVSNPWSDHSLLALWIPSQAASLHVVETKIFQLEDISQQKIHIQAGLCSKH